MRIFLCILTMVVLGLPASAQERTVLYSHHTFNGLALNPAYSGSRDMLSISLSHRSQWLGFEGAPTYQVFSLHSSLKNTKMGLGLLVMNESIGLRRHTGIYLNYAHRLTLGRGKLAMGLKAGVSNGSFEQIDLGNDDYVFTANTEKYLLPNFGLGVYYYTQGFYAGVSIPLILGYKTNASGEVLPYHDFSKYAYYLTAGAKPRIAENWRLHPSVLIQYEQSTGLVADGGLGILYKDVLGIGASYRNKGALVMLMDFKLNYQLRVGLAYDYGFQGINQYSRNSFEVALEYNFGYRVKASNPTIF